MDGADTNKITPPNDSLLSNNFLKIILIFLTLLLAAGLFYGGYLYGKLKTQNPESKIIKEKSQNLPSSNFEIKSTKNITTKWKKYVDKTFGFSFYYPPEWEIINTPPKHKMLFRECSGPILKNKSNPSTLIVVEIIPPEFADISFCWSTGIFEDFYKRKISTLEKEIQVSKWQPNDTYDPKTGEIKVSSWEGDLIQTYEFNSFFKENPKAPSIVFALIHKKDKDKNAEKIFDMVISTFSFIKPTEINMKNDANVQDQESYTWITYQNKQYSYEIKYPKEKAEVKEYSEGSYVSIYIWLDKEKKSISPILIFAQKNPEGLSREEFYAKKVNSKLEDIRPYLNIKEMSLGKVNALRIIGAKEFFRSSTPLTSYLISRNGIIITIQTTEYVGKFDGTKTIILSKEDSTFHIQLIKQILSTFKFYE